MRKPAFFICESKDTDQLHIDSTIPLLSKYKVSSILAILCGCRDWFVCDLVGNPEDWFSHNEAQIMKTEQVDRAPLAR